MDFKQTYQQDGKQRIYDFTKSKHYLQYYGQQLHGADYSIATFGTHALHQLLAYAIQDQAIGRFYGIDLKKGLLLTGSTLHEKRDLLHLLKLFLPQHLHFHIRHALELKKHFQNYGIASKGTYTQPLAPQGYCFDGLFFDHIHPYDQSISNQILTTVKERCTHTAISSHPTHLISELPFNQIKTHYSKAVVKLLTQHFNIITFTQP